MPIDNEGAETLLEALPMGHTGFGMALVAVFSVMVRSIASLVTPILKELNISYSQTGIILGSCLLNVNVYNKPMTLSKVITIFRTDKNSLTIWGIDNTSATDYTKAPTYEMP